jgi:hypothetical protein
LFNQFKTFKKYPLSTSFEHFGRIEQRRERTETLRYQARENVNVQGGLAMRTNRRAQAGSHAA